MKINHSFSSSDSEMDDNIEVEKDSGDENGYVNFISELTIQGNNWAGISVVLSRLEPNRTFFNVLFQMSKLFKCRISLKPRVILCSERPTPPRGRRPLPPPCRSRPGKGAGG